MTQNTINNLDWNATAETIKQIAEDESLKGCMFMSDVVWSINNANNWDLCKYSTPFFIAFRKCGVEDGTEQEVRERCATLGQPHIVIRLTHENGTITMKINYAV